MSAVNVVLITTHDINPHIGAYADVWPGAEEAFTPNLDRLADEGLRFDAAYAAAPVCAPSRSAMMTGSYPTSIGTMHMRTRAVLPAEVKLLPQLFREAGYYTTNDCFTDYQVDVPPTTFDDISEGAHWRNRPEGVPFFAQFHGMVTHESQIYLDDDAFAERTANVPGHRRHDPSSVTIPPYYPDTEVFRRSWARYLDLITEMDHWVGGLLQQLEDDGLAESTVVVFVSDHGVGMPRAKRWATEAGLREPFILRWPGRVAAGSVEHRPVGLVDLAPTLLRAAGLTVPAFMQGRALLEDDGTVREQLPRYVFGGRDRMDEQEDLTRTVRDERLRYIRHGHPDRSPMQHHEYADALATWSELRRLHFEEARQLAVGEPRSHLTPLQRTLIEAGKPAYELYDVTADPHETRDLAADPAFAADLARLDQALDAWQAEHGDLGLLDEKELIESWRPGGHRLITEPVTWSVANGSLELRCATPGALIGWEYDDAAGPAEPVERSAYERMLGLSGDRRRWRPYTGPVDLVAPVRVGAWRIGYAPSPESIIPI